MIGKVMVKRYIYYCDCKMMNFLIRSVWVWMKKFLMCEVGCLFVRGVVLLFEVVSCLFRVVFLGIGFFDM